mmetsp:Transcript_82501/g.163830  ORF Transcript_82501/g.163830 Transcript_82501/m.163830 type:complete len:207 (+) Transcript_82501:842-1462(+)
MVGSVFTPLSNRREVVPLLACVPAVPSNPATESSQLVGYKGVDGASKRSFNRSRGSIVLTGFCWICNRQRSLPLREGTLRNRSLKSMLNHLSPKKKRTGKMVSSSITLQSQTTRLPAATSMPQDVLNALSGIRDRTKRRYLLGGANTKDVPVSRRNRDGTGSARWIARPPDTTQNPCSPPSLRASPSAHTKDPFFIAAYGTSPATM